MLPINLWQAINFKHSNFKDVKMWENVHFGISEIWQGQNPVLPHLSGELQLPEITTAQKHV